MARVKDTESFIAKARQVHGDRYDYSQTVYRGSGKPITIVCRVHGAFGFSAASTHLVGHGCKHCAWIDRKEERTKQRTQTFIDKARKIHGDRYDYAETVCTGLGEAVTIRCRMHGLFTLANAKDHFKKKKGVVGSGCRKCNMRMGVRQRGDQPRPMVKCGQCGKQFQIDKSKLKRNKNCFCSLDCRLQRDAERKTKRAVKSLRLPVLFWSGSEWRNQGQRCDGCRNAARQLQRIAGKRKQAEFQGTWEYAIALRLAASRHRESKRKPRPPKGGNPWMALEKIKRKRQWHEKDPWEKAVRNKLSNLAKRRRRKHVANSKRRRSDEQAKGPAIQMQFDWLAA